MDSWFREIEAWGGFYTFVGTAAATLLGLVFVVVSLGKGLVGTDHAMQAVRAFYTPVIAFFSTDIVLSTVMLVPHTTPRTLSVLFGVIGIAGLLYMVASGALPQWRSLELSLDDLVFYIALPFLAYIALCVAAVLLWNQAQFALYTSAAVTILLLLIGIRNAWDLVISIARQ
jgi:hypothetical protein